MKKFTVEKLRQEMIMISKDWHPAVAKGDQGAGRTLENLLGIDENNISMPDLGNIEIKSQKSESKTLISLFTNEPSNSSSNASIPLVIQSMGWKHENAGKSYPVSEKVFSSTISPDEFTNRGMIVSVDKNKIYLKFNPDKIKKNDPDRSRQRTYPTLGDWYNDINKRISPHYSQVMPLFYDRKKIEKKLVDKLNNTFLCLRKNKTIEGKLHFKFFEGFILKNILQEKIDKMYKKGLYFDIGARTHHNHGTKLRMKKKNLFELFKTTEKILG